MFASPTSPVWKVSQTTSQPFVIDLSTQIVKKGDTRRKYITPEEFAEWFLEKGINLPRKTKLKVCFEISMSVKKKIAFYQYLILAKLLNRSIKQKMYHVIRGKYDEDLTRRAIFQVQFIYLFCVCVFKARASGSP